MTDQRGADQQSSNPEPALKSKDRFILGAIVFVALIRPETPTGRPAAVPGGTK